MCMSEIMLLGWAFLSDGRLSDPPGSPGAPSQRAELLGASCDSLREYRE